MYFNNNKLNHLLNQPPTDRLLRCFQFFANINSASINCLTHTSLPTFASVLVVEILVSGIGCSKGKCVCSAARCCQIPFHRGVPFCVSNYNLLSACFFTTSLTEHLVKLLEFRLKNGISVQCYFISFLGLNSKVFNPLTHLLVYGGIQ